MYEINLIIKYIHTLLSGLCISVEPRGIESSITVIKIVDTKTIGPILWRVLRERRHKIKDDDQSPINITAPIPIVEDILTKKKKTLKIL